MIHNDKIDEISTLFKEGKTQREISKIAGVSRGVISKILKNGKESFIENRKVGHSNNDERYFKEPFTEEVYKCPKCNCMVRKPCFACSVRKSLRIKKLCLFQN